MTVVRNEFAVVDIAVDVTGLSPRLRVEDIQTGRVVYFDALELETLVWLPLSEIERLLDPSAYRWRNEEDIPLDQAL